MAAKARAALHGRPLVEQADVDAVVQPVLAHRLRPNFAAEADGIAASHILHQIVHLARDEGDLRDAQASLPVLRPATRR
jgi:MoxR-like ATPase